MTKVYVTMTDRFMSGWGGAQGRTAKYVIACDNYGEAGIVADNARSRSEMKYINIEIPKPLLMKNGILFSGGGYK